MVQILCIVSPFALAFNARKWANDSDDCRYDLKVENDGPVTLDVPITFKASLQCASPEEYYVFIFQDNAVPPHRIRVDGSTAANVSFVYSANIYRPGVYIMKVSAFSSLWSPVLVGVASTTSVFILSEYIPGNLSISDVKVGSLDGSLYISSGSVTNITVSLHYPSSVYPLLETSYSWNVDKEQFITVDPCITYNFSVPGTYKITVSAVARVPVYNVFAVPTRVMKYKWGYFNAVVTVKDSMTSVNLTGNTYLKHGQLLDLDVSCTGSGPFEYCWRIFQPFEDVTNLTCPSPVVTTKCSFPIIYYFHDSGNYRVAILVDNYVASIQRNVEVHVYDVSLKPQLSTVIVPMVCAVLAILIITVGIVIHIRQNQQFDIETADFDFLQSDVIVVETFWEKMYHSILQMLCFKRGLQNNYYLRIVSPDAPSSSSQYGSVPE